MRSLIVLLTRGSSDFSGRLHLFLEDEVRSVVL